MVNENYEQLVRNNHRNQLLESKGQRTENKAQNNEELHSVERNESEINQNTK